MLARKFRVPRRQQGGTSAMTLRRKDGGGKTPTTSELPTRSLRRMTLGGVPRRGFKSSLETGSSLAGFKRIFPGAQHEIDTVELTDESRRLVLLREKGVAKVQVPYVLANWLRPHQRVGVKFMFDCVAGISLPPFTGCILADDVSGSLKNNYG